MFGEKHDLVHELPEFKDKIHELKMSDRHFSRLFDEYHDVDHEVRRLESGMQACSDEHLEARKKQRLALKDELFSILRTG